MAKSLYSALFDWIVLRINHALLNKKDIMESIPVRDNDAHAISLNSLHIYLWAAEGFAFSFLLLCYSACPLASWTFLVLRTLRPTALSSSASTMQTSNCNIISTTTYSTWSRSVFLFRTVSVTPLGCNSSPQEFRFFFFFNGLG